MIRWINVLVWPRQFYGLKKRHVFAEANQPVTDQEIGVHIRRESWQIRIHGVEFCYFNLYMADLSDTIYWGFHRNKVSINMPCIGMRIFFPWSWDYSKCSYVCHNVRQMNAVLILLLFALQAFQTGMSKTYWLKWWRSPSKSTLTNSKNSPLLSAPFSWKIKRPAPLLESAVRAGLLARPQHPVPQAVVGFLLLAVAMKICPETVNVSFRPASGRFPMIILFLYS